MSVNTERNRPPGSGPVPGDLASYSDSHGDGWVLFAGVMLAIVGTMNFIGGIAAIDNSKFYAGNAQYIFSDLKTWGWVILLTGIAQVAAALGIWARNQLARWVGVGFASLNALAQLLFLPAQPLWSLAIFAVDLLIIYGLVAYGGRERA
jgi:hypothetical protein